MKETLIALRTRILPAKLYIYEHLMKAAGPLRDKKRAGTEGDEIVVTDVDQWLFKGRKI